MQILTAASRLPPLGLLPPKPERRLQAFIPVWSRHHTRAFVKEGPAGDKSSLRAQRTRELEERIRKHLLCPNQTPSSYDTAWVAMVPLQSAPEAPRFPRFVEWILQNQHDDGSWGLNHVVDDPCSLGKDTISSTLACILALKKWNVGNEHIRKGLCFIGNNVSWIADEKCDTPIGFNVIFPCMIKLGNDMGLQIPVGKSYVDEIFQLRDMELQRDGAGLPSPSGRKSCYLAYIAEGLSDMHDWDDILAYQGNNGSLFNSPSATAAFAIQSHNASALKYLEFLATKFGSYVPTVYPMNIFSQLCIVDTIEMMGISSHFSGEINSILDMTYSAWMTGDDEITRDMETCAMAFRILRMHGYNTSSDVLSHFAEESRFHDSIQGHLNDTKTLLELYKASQIRIYEDEMTLENMGSWTSKLLKQQLFSSRVSRSVTPKEVENALKFPFYSATVEPLENKRNIEHFSHKRIQMRKSAYLAFHATEDILALAINDFNYSQRLYQQELEYLECWAKLVRLEQLKFARTTPFNVYHLVASTVFFPCELSDARIASIQISSLLTALDDFFDGGGSTQELKNLVALIEKWDAYDEIGFYSKNVETLFCAIYKTNCQIGAMAEKLQNRGVIARIAQDWLSLVKAYMTEAEWARKRYVPTMEEYMAVAEVTWAQSIAIGTPLYLVGPELTQDMVSDPDYKGLLKHAVICGRLLNDLCTYEKERGQGYVNSVLLLAQRYGGSNSSESIEAAKEEIKRALDVTQREFLRLVLREGGAIPKLYRDIFWNSYKSTYLFYLHGDGFGFRALQELVAAADAVIHEPLQVTFPCL